MKKTQFFSGLILGLLILFSTGCQDVESEKTGTLVIKLTDAPFPIDMIDAASVNIVKVEIRKEGDGVADGNPYIILTEEAREFNLLDLRNGITTDLIEMEVPAGSYDLIRLYVDQASLSVKDISEPYTLKVPSGAQTGIKIFIKPGLNVEGGLTSEVLLDFNIDKSFILQGNMDTPAGIKGFNFKPVIRAVNRSTAGSVEGLVIDANLLAMENVSVWIGQDTVLTSAFTDVDGYYSMLGIPAGLYNVSAATEGFDTVTFENVQIVEGNLTIQNFQLSPEEE